MSWTSTFVYMMEAKNDQNKPAASYVLVWQRLFSFHHVSLGTIKLHPEKLQCDQGGYDVPKKRAVHSGKYSLCRFINTRDTFIFFNCFSTMSYDTLLLKY